ncbi:MAG: nucleotidyltransferase domain-containing protein [Geothermobacteraceae bacterium]
MAGKIPAEEVVARVRTVLHSFDEVCFAYLFGSVARGNTGPLSDLDIAVWVAGDIDCFQFRLRCLDALMSALGRDDIDLVVLNEAPLELAYRVVRDGRVIVESRLERVAFETRVIDLYLDAEPLRRTQRAYLKERLSGGSRG